ncbi:TolC family protein (plasmid) [Burkholderia thailandensis]|uniref:TolC family protein n=1 Tax=Burkholderia thailandensis TaxID=57975 RepID=UPI00192DAEA2|nr:TolC family protein [Burkholderia thailandensis]MBS2132236.1 TolC family protein [Burkholderia thailandensis]QRA15329.1 TolC family protein [Burkholderia thailandensis]
MFLRTNAPGSRRARARARALFLVLALGSFTAYAQDAAMTLDAALQSATDRSSAMQAAQAAVRAGSQAAVKAGQLPNPMLTAGVDNLPIDGPQRFTIGQDFMTQRRIGIEQEWVSPKKRRLRSSLADRKVDRERSDYLAQLANVRERTAAAWLSAVYAKKALALQEELADHMTHELAATEASYRGAKATAADVAQAQVMLAQTQDDLLKAQQTYRSALITLSRWTAVPVGDVVGEPPEARSGVAELPPDQLRQVQPALIAAAANVAVANAATAVASSDRSPNWTWDVSYQQRGGAYSNMVSIGVTIPLPLDRKDREDRDVAEQAELATQARLMLDDTQRQVEADIQNLAATLETGRKRVAQLKQTLLPAADRRVQLADAAYRGGTGSLADTFAARRAQLDAQLQVLDLQRDVSLDWARLDYQVVPAAMAAAE